MEMAIRQEPLLVFINGRSGGNQGLDLLTKFRHYLNPHQVFDLASGGPHIGYGHFTCFIILTVSVCPKSGSTLFETLLSSGF